MVTRTRLGRSERSAIYDSHAHLIAFDGAFSVGSGIVLPDGSMYRSHGAISGAQWAAGLHKNCLDFIPGTPSYVEIPASYTQLDFTSENFSIIARIYVDSLATERRVFERGSDSVEGYTFLVAASGRSLFRTSQAGAAQISQSPVGTVTTGAWYTVGITRSGTSVIPYSNGSAVVDTVGTHTNPLTSNRTAKIGVRDDLVSSPFDGKIEFLRIWRNVVLTAQEHLDWHNKLKK